MKARIIVYIPILIGTIGLFFLFKGQMTIGAIIPAAVFVFVSCFLIWAIRKGYHNFIFIEDVRLKDEDRKQRFKVESLYKNLAHTDEWLQGFALGVEFFIDNYLSKYTLGPTEEMFWNMTRQVMNTTKEKDKDFTEDAYRTFMITALMRNNGITEEEYEKLGRMMKKNNAKEVLGEIVYSKIGTELEKEDIEKSLNEAFKKEHE